MRPIKFRGRHMGKWVYGGIEIRTSNGEVFIGSHLVKSLVDPETVGQLTGLLDKNGKEIYEGDILSWDATGNRRAKNREVIYRDDLCAFHLKDWGFLGGTMRPFEIIGNVWENPELVK